jgi:type IV secretion system protein VirD4
VLGRAGRALIAAERAQSVVVFGPTQSGKTSALAVPAILGWQGPVVATSVKTDLVDLTWAHRRGLGPVAVFDPAGATGYDRVPWSPVPASRTWPSARRAATALCDGAKAAAGTMTDGDFWYAAAAKLLAPLLFAAATGNRRLSDVARWVDTQEADEVLDLLHEAGVVEAVDAARACFTREERQRSSVYTTVETVLDPLIDQRGTATGLLDPGAVLDAGGTLYLCAPAHDQRRQMPLFAAVARATVEHAFDRVAATRRPLDPPLLVVLDEAANIAPLADLDGLAATAAGHGVQLVTVWHDLAQIVARYGPRATTVVNNHRAKVFLSGISDPQTLDYASQLIGDEEVVLAATTSGGRSGPSTTRSPTTRRLVTPGGVRRLAPGEALLVYGGLPPARLTLRPWTDDPVLRRRRWAPVSDGPTD